MKQALAKSAALWSSTGTALTLAVLSLSSSSAPPEATPQEPAAVVSNSSVYDVMESRFCADCHPAIYAEHEQSTHGRAFTDAEVRLATARFAHKDCIICHTPRPIFETGVGQNPRRRHHGLDEGNTCMTCHWQPDYDYEKFTGGDECRDAFHPDVGTVEACASCHRNHGTPYQWEKAPTGKESERTCVDCHMAEVERPVAVGGPVRTVRKHIFPGSRNEAQVRRAYQYEARIDGNRAIVTIKNRGAGHNFPTELKQRAVESVITVFDADGNEVANSRKVFRDPYKRPYGLQLPVNTQIPGGESRTHEVPLGVADGTVDCKLFFKQYYPIDDYHSGLSRVLESRLLPFAGIEPSNEEVDSAPRIVPVAPENIDPELASPANLIDFARPPIGTVEIEIPEGDSPEDIQGLVELFQFPVIEGNVRARARLAEIGLPAVPALIDALGSWDNKTYNQALTVLAKIGKPARPAVVAALEDERLYVRLHARELLRRTGWRGSDIEATVARALEAPHALDRAGAAELVGALRYPSLAGRATELLGDKDPDVVRASAQSLATLGHTEAVPAMEEALQAAHYVETKRDLALALAQLGSTAGIPVLLKELDHNDDLIRESIFEAFFEATGRHEGYDPLAPRWLRLQSMAELQGDWAENGSTDWLQPLDPERDPIAEEHAWKIVEKLGGSDYLQASDQDESYEEELVAMGKYAVPGLVRGLKFPAGFAVKRAAICRTLGRIGDRRAAPALGATLRDPVLNVAGWAAWALEAVGDSANTPALRRYEQRLRTAIATNRLPAGFGPPDRALAQAVRTRLILGDLDARHTLAGLLLSEDLYSRQIAFDALQRVYGEDRGYDPEAEPSERRAAATRWME